MSTAVWVIVAVLVTLAVLVIFGAITIGVH
jgi:hypothetical protein